MANLNNNMLNDDELENVTGGKGPLDTLISSMVGYNIGDIVYYCSNGSKQLAEIISIEKSICLTIYTVRIINDSSKTFKATDNQISPA